MGWESSDVVRFDLGPPQRSEEGSQTLKSAYNLFIISPRILGCETNL